MPDMEEDKPDKKHHHPKKHKTAETLALSRKSIVRTDALPTQLELKERSEKTFPTGSSYFGTWNALGLSGEGTYTFPHKGVTYKGGFYDGMFHGKGELLYDCGAILQGRWDKGKIVEKNLFFDDGLEYKENDWTYCRLQDRRFTIELDEGLEPAGRSYLTAEQPTPEIPYGYYDVGDGFYEPITKTVYKYEDITAIVRSPGEREQRWIEANCRTNPDLPRGPCDFLYEKWLDPSLEAEYPPPPPVRCKTFEEEREARYSMYVTSDRASRSNSRVLGEEDFYRPTYLNIYKTDAKSRRASARSVKQSVCEMESRTPKFDTQLGSFIDVTDEKPKDRHALKLKESPFFAQSAQHTSKAAASSFSIAAFPSGREMSIAIAPKVPSEKDDLENNTGLPAARTKKIINW